MRLISADVYHIESFVRSITEYFSICDYIELKYKLEADDDLLRKLLKEKVSSRRYLPMTTYGLN